MNRDIEGSGDPEICGLGDRGMGNLGNVVLRDWTFWEMVNWGLG